MPSVWVHRLSGESNCCDNDEWFAEVTVEVRTTGGRDPEGIVVTGQWAGAYGGIVSAQLDDDGEVEFETAGIVDDVPVTFTVLDIVDPGLTYDPARNRSTSVMILSPL